MDKANAVEEMKQINQAICFWMIVSGVAIMLAAFTIGIFFSWWAVISWSFALVVSIPLNIFLMSMGMRLLTLAENQGRADGWFLSKVAMAIGHDKCEFKEPPFLVSPMVSGGAATVMNRLRPPIRGRVQDFVYSKESTGIIAMTPEDDEDEPLSREATDGWPGESKLDGARGECPF